ncbi:hypothetical protein TorRG33x02_002160 [Trema orientale]|uniref:Uncharacterized protein n=1 Tax=Trema orientale TaxID=63057 RepID=A0A2P5G1K9_TREOI|nr:hypothetical protein TorRG33x02_002160 [Trema orientale]
MGCNYISRDGNTAAHTLARFALRISSFICWVDEEEIPVEDKDCFFGPFDLPAIPSSLILQQNDQIPEESVLISTSTALNPSPSQCQL